MGNGNLSTRQYIALLQNNGFVHTGTKGSHMKFTRGNDSVIVAMHSKQICPLIIKSSIKKFNLK